VSDDCPCDTGEPFAACCGLALDGVPAPTALALMRSRYTAFVRKDFAYLVATHDPATRGTTNARELARATSRTVWLGLEIVMTAAGGEADDTGVVEFIARGSSNGKGFAQRERSRFRRVAGRWVYSDGDIA
jgi:SEC-C motif-containing protein